MSRISSRRQAVSVNRGGEETPDEVVAGVLALFPAIKITVEVVVDPFHRFHPHGDQLVHRVPLVGFIRKGEVLEAEKFVEILQRQAHDGQEDRRRERFAPLVVDVSFARLDERVNQLIGQAAHARRQGRDPLGGKHRIEKSPVLGVLGSVQAERDGGPAAAQEPGCLPHLMVLVDVEDVLHLQQRDVRLAGSQYRCGGSQVHIHLHGLGAGPGSGPLRLLPGRVSPLLDVGGQPLRVNVCRLQTVFVHLRHLAVPPGA